MIESTRRRSIIRADSVRENTHPVLVESDGGGTESDRALSIVPLMDGHEVRGIEVHCCCGSSIVIECLYDPVTDTADVATAASPTQEGQA